MKLRRFSCLASLTAFLATGACLAAGTPALAQNAPGWEVNSHSHPTDLVPGGGGTIAVEVYNIGGAESAAGATLTDTLPAGVSGVEGEGWTCDGKTPDTCTRELPSIVSGEREEYLLSVVVSAGALEGPAANTTTVTGGGTEHSAASSDRLTVSRLPAGFGLADVDGWASNADGTIDTQAGSHPFALTFAFDVDTNGNAVPEGEARNLTVSLPTGIVGNPTAVPRCTHEQFDREVCPTGSQVGIVKAGLGGYVHLLTYLFPLYNLTPPPGHPAEFAFVLFGNRVYLDASVRSDGDYGITENVDNITQRLVVTANATVWGVPAERAHDPQRNCINAYGSEEFGCPSTSGAVPFLTLPTSCSGPQTFSARVNSWTNEAETAEASFVSHDQQGSQAGLDGCDRLSFNPALAVAPDTKYGETPAGLTVELKTPQDGLAGVGRLASSNIKDTTVTLPEGVVINPGQAAGLAACQAGEDGIGTLSTPSCPNASIVGTDEIETPLLAKPLKGDVYVLQSNPPDLKLLVAASGEGVNLKLVGDVHLDEQTGRLTTTFQETPELPFTTFRLAFSGGARAALVTPPSCGSYRTDSQFTPWSEPFTADAFSSSQFAISAGPGGGGCPAASLPFSPQLTAGATTDQAGGYTNFSLLLTREDGQQRIGSLQFKTPKGLLGMISNVPLCGEAQANAGNCPEASQIGHTVVEAGPGPYPLVVPEPGQPAAPIYLTEGYRGAPYGLSIVVPLHVGPFTLQTQVVRAKIAVDPVTTQLTITTDPLPTIIDGIPADLRAINAVIDRSRFMFNPTNCEPQSFSGIATSTEGTSASISSHFQVGSCRSLTFKPNFKVSTSGKTSRAGGASLDAKIVYPTGRLQANQASSQANIAYVKVELPKALPSRLTTLQKACLAKVFEENPANCPKESLVGSATAVTPVLPVQLTGPAYFVSHGGEAFPSLIIVLQGYGVTVDLVGTTFISKTGITSSTFKQVPDVPVTSFELKLPEGPYSALAANGNLCKQKLVVPTQFVGQNGAEMHSKTRIATTGCTKAKRAKDRKHPRKAARDRAKRKK